MCQQLYYHNMATDCIRQTWMGKMRIHGRLLKPLAVLQLLQVLDVIIYFISYYYCYYCTMPFNKLSVACKVNLYIFFFNVGWCFQIFPQINEHAIKKSIVFDSVVREIIEKRTIRRPKFNGKLNERGKEEGKYLSLTLFYYFGLQIVIANTLFGRVIYTSHFTVETV